MALIQLLRQRSLISLNRKNAEEKALNDMYDKAASDSQVLSLVFLLPFFFVFIPFLRYLQVY